MQDENAEVAVEPVAEVSEVVNQVVEDNQAADEAVEQEKPRNKVQERIDELTREKHESRREAEYWRSKALAETAAKPAEKAEPADKRPIVDDFEDYDSYVEALSDYKANQAVAKALEAREQASKQKAAASTWEQKVEEAGKKNPDIARILRSDEFDRTVISQPMADAITDSDIGPEIAAHLAKDQAESRRIASLSPVAAMREILKLEAKLATEPASAQETKALSKAGAPIAPITGGKGAGEKDPSTMTDKEFADWRARQIAQRRGRR